MGNFYAFDSLLTYYISLITLDRKTAVQHKTVTSCFDIHNHLCQYEMFAYIKTIVLEVEELTRSVFS